ncbi:MAG TPA: hypothetical protein VLB00_06680 [Gemmatimonadales bacterium]|nr:hypothetical protein [Gemmatimonadales bacterium]
MVQFLRNTLRAGALAVALAACSDSTGPGTDDLVGSYDLITIDGASLPVIVDQIGEDKAEITMGTVTLDEDGIFGDVTEIRITEGGVVTTEVQSTQGTWTVSGSTVTFLPNDGSANYTMTWDGQLRLTQLFQGFTLVYEQGQPLLDRR